MRNCPIHQTRVVFGLSLLKIQSGSDRASKSYEISGKHRVLNPSIPRSFCLPRSIGNWCDWDRAIPLRKWNSVDRSDLFQESLYKWVISLCIVLNWYDKSAASKEWTKNTLIFVDLMHVAWFQHLKLLWKPWTWSAGGMRSGPLIASSFSLYPSAVFLCDLVAFPECLSVILDKNMFLLILLTSRWWYKSISCLFHRHFSLLN